MKTNLLEWGFRILTIPLVIAFFLLFWVMFTLWYGINKVGEYIFE